jgi:hypothetical protein
MHFKRSLILSVALASLLLFIQLPLVMAQTAGTGALAGTVKDGTGAVIPNVAVTITNDDTGQARSATSGTDGSYRVALLSPGTYKVRFSANGFKSIEVPGVVVNVTETPVLDRTLELGAQSQQVTIEANAETIQTASSSLGTTVGSNVATSIPLTTRNYTNILGLSAGANASVNNASNLGRGGMEIAVNGARSDQNTYQMDGVSIVNYASSGLNTEGATYPTIGIPNPDTLAEFKIQTSLYDAGYGRNPGANVNVVTKSGSNVFHGTAFEFFRNTVLNANDFFRNRTCGLTPAACAGGAKQVLNQNQFGGVLGGPIRKDKLFIFGSYQQTWQKNGAAQQGYSQGITLLPIPAGDRSNTNAFRAALGAAFCNSPTNPGGNGAGAGLQVDCAGQNINPIAIKFLQAKTADGSYFIPSSTNGAVQPGVTFSIPAYDKEYQGMLNSDYLINAKNTLTFRFYRSYEPQFISFLGASYLPGTPATDPFGYHNMVTKLTSIVTNSLVNEARLSYQRTTTDAFQHPPESTYASNIYPNIPAGQNFLGGGLPFSPVINIPGFFQAGGSSSNDETVHNFQAQIGDQISWTHGKHSIRAGGEFEQVNWFWDYQGLSHGITAFQTFSDFLIGLPGGCGAAVPGACNGSGFSNILNTNNFSVRSGPGGIVHGYKARNGNWFVQDDFKVNQRLTLNLGVRWEFDGLMADKYGNATNLWLSQIQTVPVPGTSPQTATPAGWVVVNNYDTKTWGALPPGVLKLGSPVPSKNGVPLTDFAPRAGFAWQPIASNKLVLRGGFGFFYDRVPGNTIGHAVEQSPPYSITLDQGASTNQFASLAAPFQSIPLGTFPTRWVNFATNQGSDLAQSFMIDKLVTPLVYSWNLNAQYQVAPTWMVEVGYVGSHGIHQPNTLHILNGALLATATTPINGVITNTTANTRLRVPYLGFSPTGLQAADNQGDYKYNSLQATVRKSLSYGLTLQAAYTYGRAFTTQGYSTGIPPGPGSTNIGDPTHPMYGLNPQYRPQRLVINYTYDLSLRRATGVLGKVVNGWSASGITTIQGGQPLSIVDSRGGAIFGLSGATALLASTAQIAPGATYGDLVTPGDTRLRLGGASGGPGYIKTAALTTIPAVGAIDGAGGGTGWGNSGVGIIYGPGQFNFDATIAKVTTVGGIHENAVLQFRAEFFNMFNHPQFNIPVGLNFGAPGNFGQITSTSVNPRLIQLALKYVF